MLNSGLWSWKSGFSVFLMFSFSFCPHLTVITNMPAFSTSTWFVSNSFYVSNLLPHLTYVLISVMEALRRAFQRHQLVESNAAITLLHRRRRPFLPCDAAHVTAKFSKGMSRAGCGRLWRRLDHWQHRTRCEQRNRSSATEMLWYHLEDDSKNLTDVVPVIWCRHKLEQLNEMKQELDERQCWARFTIFSAMKVSMETS